MSSSDIVGLVVFLVGIFLLLGVVIFAAFYDDARLKKQHDYKRKLSPYDKGVLFDYETNSHLSLKEFFKGSKNERQ